MIFDDITRNYHRGNPQSTEANKATRKSQDRARIIEFLHGRGDYGATSYEARIALGMRHQTCSARFSDLKRAVAIIETGVLRPTDTGSKAAVCVLVRFAKRSETDV